MDSRTAHERLEELWHAHAAAVLAYGRRRAPEHAAQDAVADTFAVAWRRIEAVPAGDAALPWLYGVARNVLRTHRRGEARQGRLADRLEPPPPDGDPATLAQCGSDDVHRALARLGEADREVLTLFAWEGLDAAAAAAVLGCSVGAVRVRLHRARRRIAVLLEPEAHATTVVNLAIAGDA